MKLSRTAWLILGIVVVALIFLLGIWMQARQNDDNYTLTNKLRAAQVASGSIIQETNSSEEQVSQLRERLNADSMLLDQTRAGFSPPESIEYGEYLFQIGDSSNVIVSNIDSSSPSDKEQDGLTYQIATIKLDITGTPDNIYIFIDQLAKSEHFKNASIEEMDMVGLDQDTASLSISLTIFGYKSD